MSLKRPGSKPTTVPIPRTSLRRLGRSAVQPSSIACGAVRSFGAVIRPHRQVRSPPHPWPAAVSMMTKPDRSKCSTSRSATMRGDDLAGAAGVLSADVVQRKDVASFRSRARGCRYPKSGP